MQTLQNKTKYPKNVVAYVSFDALGYWNKDNYNYRSNTYRITIFWSCMIYRLNAISNLWKATQNVDKNYVLYRKTSIMNHTNFPLYNIKHHFYLLNGFPY